MKDNRTAVTPIRPRLVRDVNAQEATSGHSDAFAGIEGDRPVLVPPRAYDLRFEHFETSRMFGKALKLILWFSIAEAGDYIDHVLPRYYNVMRIIGQPQKNGGFKVGFHSDFLREYTALFGPAARLDRIPMTAFVGKFVRGKVKTVGTGRNQQPIPSALQYSVISGLTELLK